LSLLEVTDSLISAILLAGGKSSRMGRDKAFLELGHNHFVSRIASELLRVSDDLMVVVGRKAKEQFYRTFDFLRFDGHDPSQVRILNDQYSFENPLAGILTGFENARHSIAAVVACDMPLMNGNVIKALRRNFDGFDCVVPIWDDYSIEPLCGVYGVERSMQAAKLAILDSKVGPKHMVSYIPKVNYVPVCSLRQLDPNLESLLNINYPRDYDELMNSLSHERTGVTPRVSLEVRLGSKEESSHA